MPNSWIAYPVVPSKSGHRAKGNFVPHYSHCLPKMTNSCITVNLPVDYYDSPPSQSPRGHYPSGARFSELYGMRTPPNCRSRPCMTYLPPMYGKSTIGFSRFLMWRVVGDAGFQCVYISGPGTPIPPSQPCPFEVIASQPNTQVVASTLYFCL